ncbi:MAG: bifunctional DNA-formamidopyrimidine glycosylase/DNA-(apurinic or apyrimidinic site) lyase [Gemmataceae bacterium]|nr:bifunctional DNA-formamidopyrimidine glycosylase/DNA-(apurinic or apyrimidinic site) lyase [Gemmata sp.]MDW8196021.1 bifunctional DNA-formamidopyrimidine glycosylase/DNA-(apurinic or apyrimidinic site) lyase [Gemmataceae bacterium]
MPELPEVETVVRDLRPALLGRTVLDVQYSRKKLRHPWQPRWNAQIRGLHITDLRRRGKWILVDCAGPTPSADPPLVRVHLGMTGQFTVATPHTPRPDHVHVIFQLDHGDELRFRDPRRFGGVTFFAHRSEVEAAMNAELGPEPLEIPVEYFRHSLRTSRRNLKAILLDQKTLAGVGNIYADEACFRARLHPGRRGHSLTPQECDRLRQAIETVIRRAIASRGSTIRDYIGGSGLRGQFQNELAVYGRTGEPCRVCQTPIACQRLAGRSSHFCPNCQR